MRKLYTSSHTRYVNYILPKLSKDVQFKDTIITLNKIFGEPGSTFSKRYQCMQLTKADAEDVIEYGGKVNRACEEFEFKRMNIDQYKCLIFICGLKGQDQADIRTRHLRRIESESSEAPTTLQQLIDEYQRIVNLKADTSIVENQPSSKPAVLAVAANNSGRHQQLSKPDRKSPRTPC